MVSPSFATKVTCTGSLSSATGQNLFANCDTSSLTQSGRWYYRFKLTNSPNFISYKNDSKVCFSYLSNAGCSSSQSITDSVQVLAVANYRLANFIYYFQDFSDSYRMQYMSSYNVTGTFSGTLNYQYIISDEEPFSQSDCPVCPASPSGELAITSNGEYDVTSYASVDVDVPETVVQGDYHDDLQALKQAVITCGAVLLVIYFFYCIYRMFFRTLGGV